MRVQKTPSNGELSREFMYDDKCLSSAVCLCMEGSFKLPEITIKLPNYLLLG